jgi:hypothetical protein
MHQRRTTRLRRRIRWRGQRSKCSETRNRRSLHVDKSNATPSLKPQQPQELLENGLQADALLPEPEAMRQESMEKLLRLNRSFFHAMKKLKLKAQTISKWEIPRRCLRIPQK